MSISKRGDIIDYETPDGGFLPLLVVHVNENDDTVSGVVFDTDGNTQYVVIPPDEPVEESDADKAKDAELADLRAQLAAKNAPAPAPVPEPVPAPTPELVPAPTPEPVATAPEESPDAGVHYPDAVPAPDANTQGDNQ